MNLTSKRMLQFMTVCAGFCALTAVAGAPTVTWVSDSFEAPEGTNQNPIAVYKMTVSGELNETTNVLWQAAADDASKIVTNDAERANYSGIRPLPSADTNLVLELATEGNTLTRHVIGEGGVAGQTFDVNSVFVDTLIKFRPSEDTPSISNDVKLAVYVNVNSNLVVHHGVESADPTNSVFDTINISPTNWYRLTIKLSTMGPLGVFEVFLNGEALTHENATGEGVGNVFLTAASGDKLSAVAFQGTGYVDELVVGNDADLAAPPAGILLTLVYDDSLGTVKTNGATVINNGTVPNNTLIEIVPNDWYNVTNVLGEGITYVGQLYEKPSTGTVSAASSATATISFAQYSGTYSMGAASVDAAKLSAWAIANNKLESDVGANAADWLDEYLLNIAPSSETNMIAITSIAVGATDATIKVVASSPVVDFNNINGELHIYTATNLVTGFGAEHVTVGVGFDKNQNTNIVTVPLTAGSFIKAKVE